MIVEVGVPRFIMRIGKPESASPTNVRILFPV
jgi:hypothetical protein